MQRRELRRLVGAGLLASVLALGVPSGQGVAAGGEPFNGTFTAEAVRPPECTSPVGFCTHGLLVDTNGRTVATYDFTMLTNEPTGEGTQLRFTGRSVITKIAAPFGIMNGQDDGVIELRPVGGSPFTTRVHVVGGTAAYERAQGLITATGELDLASGATAGAYTGTIGRAE